MKKSNQIVRKLGYSLSLFASLMFISVSFGQDTKTVSGTVYDDSETPLPGANVTVKGKSIGTTTDFDGNYTINVAETDVLVFSYLGFLSQTIFAEGKNRVDINLKPDAQQLDDVVVIGYGTQSRSKVSGAISKVETEEFENIPSVNPVQALAGKVAGLNVQVTTGQPGAGANIFLRGGTSTNPEQDGVLYVVDGITRNDINDINPDDIESLQVLKDAASTAIYGSRAANGVILVTTKSGKGLAGKGKVSFDFTSGFQSQNKRYPFASARDYLIATRRSALAADNPNFYLEGGRFAMSTGNIDAPGGYGFSRYTTEFFDNLVTAEGQSYVDDLLNNQGYETLEDPATGRQLIFKDTDFQDILFRTGFSQNYNLAFEGASDKANYRASLGYVDQEGIVLGTGYERYSILLNSGYQIKDNLRIDGTLQYQANDSQTPTSLNGTINRSSRLPHTSRLYLDDGTPGVGESGGSPRSRLHEIFYEDFTDQSYRTTIGLNLDWEIVKGLHFKPSSSYYSIESLYESFEKYNQYDTRRQMSASRNRYSQLMVDGVLNYDTTINDSHNIATLLGVNYTREQNFNLSGSGQNAPTDLIPTLNASATDFERTSSFRDENKLASLFGRVNYDFNAKYLLSASFRVDGSSRFADKNQWALFPSVSAGWNVHMENFWGSDNFISRLKIRGSWGQAGNNNLSYFDTQGEYQTGRNYLLNGGLLQNRLENLNLVWETTTTTDVGIDLGLFDNRINLLVDYYSKLTDDRLLNKRLPAQTGFGNIRANLGSLRNRGVEIELQAKVLKVGDFSWDAVFNMAFNRSVVVSLPDNGEAKNRIEGGEIFDPESGEYIKAGGLAEGERYGGRWAFDLIGVYATDEEAAQAPNDIAVSPNKLGVPKRGGDAIWRDVDDNGTIDYRDLVFVGYTDPDKIGGMVNTFQYKGFSTRFVMDFALGHVIDNGHRVRSNSNGRNNVATYDDILTDKFWQEQGDIAQFPRYDVQTDFDQGYRNHQRLIPYTGVGNGSFYASDNSLYYSKGDFLAFREISITYSLPQTILKKLPLNELKFTLGAYNLGYITKYDGLTPEVYGGFDYGQYPRPRQIQMGLKIGL